MSKIRMTLKIRGKELITEIREEYASEAEARKEFGECVKLLPKDSQVSRFTYTFEGETTTALIAEFEKEISHE